MYMVKDVGEWGVGSGTKRCEPTERCVPVSITPHSPLPTQLRFLHPPLSGDLVLEQHQAPTPLEYDLDIVSNDWLSPPFIVDAPHLANCLHSCCASRFSFNDCGYPTPVHFHLHPLRHVERPKSVRPIPHSALRTRVHSRSARSGVPEDGTMA